MARGKLTISLAAIRANYRSLAERSEPAICAAVVKADAYGLGMRPIAQALWLEGARHFFVALPEEGVNLRAVLPEATIYVLNGLLKGEEDAFLDHRLVPVLNDEHALQNWRETASKTRQVLPAVLNVDTGLNRLGFNSLDFVRCMADAQRLESLDILYVMSHLACADVPSHPMNQQQRDRFINARSVAPHVKASLAASDGIFCGREFHFDMVRPGAALYGLNPTPGSPNPMLPCLQLSVPIMQIREVEQDGTVGYAASRNVKKGQQLATVSLGYADGFARSLSNNGSLFYGDTALPVMGRVSMDVVVVDLSPLQTQLRKGDMLDIPPTMLDVFSEYQSPDDLARAAGTIGYEVLTSLGQRFERHYLS